jgi:glucans biosynthesis protein
MITLDRRRLMTGLGALATGMGETGMAASRPAFAQGGQDADTQPDRRRFGFNDVAGRAQKLAANPFDANVPQLPQAFDGMDWDKWRQIRFRPEKALLRGGGSRFSLQAFHLGAAIC